VFLKPGSGQATITVSDVAEFTGNWEIVEWTGLFLMLD
jgi:hypothetical protein